MRSTCLKASSSSRSARSVQWLKATAWNASRPRRPNVVHTFRNSSDATAVFLNLHAPSSGFGNVIRGRAKRASTVTTRPRTEGDPFADAVFTRPEEGETHRARRQHAPIVKADLPQLSSSTSTFRLAFEGVDPHVHEDHVDCFYVLEGEVEFLVGERARA